MLRITQLQVLIKIFSEESFAVLKTIAVYEMDLIQRKPLEKSELFLFVAAIPFHSITFVPCPICAPFTLGTKEEQWKNNIARLTHKGGQVFMHELIF